MLKQAILLVLVTLIGFLSPLNSFPVNEQESTCKPFIEFYADNYLSAVIVGQGNAGVADIGDISFANLNPASFEIKNDAQIYYEYGMKNDVKLFADITDDGMETDSYKSAMSAAFAYKFSEYIRAGILYTAKNSYCMDQGVAYNTHNNEIIDTFPLTEKHYVRSVNVPISYVLEKFRFGVGLNVDIYHSKIQNVYTNSLGSYSELCGELDFLLFQPKIGAIYSPLNNLNFGFSFLVPVDKKLSTKCQTFDLDFQKNKFPMELTVGTKYTTPSIPLSILVDFDHKHYSDHPEFVDANNFHFGLEYKLVEKLHLRTGMFTNFDIRNTDYTFTYDGAEYDYWNDSETYEDRNYLTFGMSYFWKRTEINLAVADNSLLTDSDIKQTYAKLGFTIQLAHPE